MKDLTTKEFKEILKGAGLNFEVYKWEGILNMIVGEKMYSAEKYEAKGNKVLADSENEKADYIYKALENRGYYK